MAKKENKIKWVEVARRGPTQPLLVIDSFLESYKEGYFGRAHRVRWNPQYYRQFDRARWFSKEDYERYGAILKKASRGNKVTLFTYAQEYHKRITAYRNFGNKYSQEVFSSYTNRKLAKVFSEWFEHTKQIWSFGYDYIFINQFLPDTVSSIVADKVTDVWKQNKYLGILFEADEASEVQLEKRNLINIARYIRTNQLNISDKVIEKKLQNHLNKFAHLGFYYFRGSAYTIKDLKKRLTGYIKLSPSEFKKFLSDFRRRDKGGAQTRKVIKELQMDKKIMLYVQYIKRWASLSNHVDETFGYVVHKLMPLWQEIAKRLGITYKQFYFLLGNEVITALQKSELTKSLKQESIMRHRDHLLILEGGRKKILVGKALERYAKKEKQKEVKIKNTKLLKGQAASPGYVKGRIRLVFVVHDVDKVERGEILVATATNPTYVPAMERAQAIVTDEGGLLSHAAIVSRELKVPCVVGTKIATKVLKDGDLVEVDANKGAVRIIKKAN